MRTKGSLFERTKAYLKTSSAGPTLEQMARLYRRVFLYPIRRTRNLITNLYKYRLISAWIRGIRRHGWRTRATIGFTPDQPNRTSQIYRIMLMNRYRMVKPDDGPPDIAVYWAYGAGNKEPTTSWPLHVNAHCRDISKRHVDAVHLEVFGYGLEIDPLTYHGEAFVKSDDNALHDGHLEQMPIRSVKPGVVYQRLVRNELPDGTRQDIRIPVVGGLAPFVYLVYRRLDNTISGKLLASSRMRDLESTLSKPEIESVGRFCHALGLEYGELDGLRDQTDGRLYIVDANRAVGASILPPEHRFWEQLTIISNLFDSRNRPEDLSDV